MAAKLAYSGAIPLSTRSPVMRTTSGAGRIAATVRKARAANRLVSETRLLVLPTAQTCRSVNWQISIGHPLTTTLAAYWQVQCGQCHSDLIVLVPIGGPPAMAPRVT